MYIIRNKNTKEVIRISQTPIAMDGEIKGLDPELEVVEEVWGVSKETQAFRQEEAAQRTALLREAKERAIAEIIKIKDTDIGKILYDQAVGRGEIEI